MNRLRLFHMSDIHVREDRPGWTVPDFFTKRATGWCNLALRKRRFAGALHLLGRLESEIRTERPDAVVFSGDATALGFASEFRSAAKALCVGDTSLPTGIAVPGNHDHYVHATVAAGDFESAFAPWLVGQRIEPHTYPFAREVGGVWIVAVNSSRPNLLAWDARGEVDSDQLERLDQLLTGLPDAPRILVTHYPYCQRNGKAEPFWHGLRDRVSLAIVLTKHNVRLWLCGHRHKSYIVQPTLQAPFAVVCAGSATQLGRAGFMDIQVEDCNVTARRHVYQPAKDRYVPESDAVVFRDLFKS